MIVEKAIHPLKAASSARREAFALILCIIVYYAMRLVALRERPINAVFDEGVHLELMQLLAEGRGSLYRDFLFVHPPGVIWAGAWLWKHGIHDIFILRKICIVVCSVSLVPFYGMARRLYGVRIALLSLILLIVTPGLATWLARSVMLDTILQIPVCIALWQLVHRKDGPSTSDLFGAGLVLGLGAAIKAIALPIAIAFEIALWWTYRSTQANKTRKAAWLPFACGFAITFSLLTSALWRLPNYGFYAYGLNGAMPFNWRARPYELINGFYMLPLQMSLGVAGVWRMAFKGATDRERLLGRFALIYTALILILPRGFYWRYLLPAVPIYTIGVVLWMHQAASVSVVKRRMTFAAATVSGVVACITLGGYYLYTSVNPPAYGQALAMLKASPKPIFNLDPLWTVASEQRSPQWAFASDAEWRVPKISVPQDFDRILAECPTVFLDHKTLKLLPPETEQIIRRNYHTVFRYLTPADNSYIEVLQR